MAHSTMLYAAEIGLCLKEINVPKMFLEDTLRKMASELKSMDPQSEAVSSYLTMRRYFTQLSSQSMLLKMLYQVYLY